VSANTASAGKSRDESTFRSKAGSGAAGAGSGTLLVLLANNLPHDNPWKSWLILIAPSLSVAIGILYSWARKSVESYLNKRELAQLIRNAKKTLTEAVQNPNTSEEHRQQLRKELEELEVLLVRTDVDRIRILTSSVTASS
jgi:hypothetical protein